MDLSERERESLAEVGRLLRAIGGAIKTAIILALPVLIRLACALVAVGGTAFSFGALVVAFGGDGIAVIPAGALALAPVAVAIMANLSWGGLLVAGGAGLVVGFLAPALTSVELALVCVAFIGAIVLHTLTEQTGDSEDEQPEADATQQR